MKLKLILSILVACALSLSCASRTQEKILKTAKAASAVTETPIAERRQSETQEPDMPSVVQQQPVSAEPGITPQSAGTEISKNDLTQDEDFMKALKEEIAKRFQERMQHKQKVSEKPELDMVEQQSDQNNTEMIKPPEHQEAPRTEEERDAMKKAENWLRYQITGMVIDQTVSPFGSHFYDNFYIKWEAPQISQTYNVYIHERTDASFTFLLTVKVDEYLVWAKRLRPRFQEIEEAVDEALQRVTLFLENYEAIQADLAGIDLKGNGY